MLLGTVQRVSADRAAVNCEIRFAPGFVCGGAYRAEDPDDVSGSCGDGDFPAWMALSATANPGGGRSRSRWPRRAECKIENVVDDERYGGGRQRDDRYSTECRICNRGGAI
ncbi:hypothetical protein JMF97_22570 [Micromonospora fiedleri]|uniref:Uncharacterized protein n=1 Tax=Micromonospora fiedleri TaxID=1157498 RepID=A0ABS1UVR8_9ACTN|nr:hypothetical protein [Micromonospora fiedleri]MBL6278950.1 hypothetical protein [Micromonospora fiedleri]